MRDARGHMVGRRGPLTAAELLPEGCGRGAAVPALVSELAAALAEAEARSLPDGWHQLRLLPAQLLLPRAQRRAGAPHFLRTAGGGDAQPPAGSTPQTPRLATGAPRTRVAAEPPLEPRYSRPGAAGGAGAEGEQQRRPEQAPSEGGNAPHGRSIEPALLRPSPPLSSPLRAAGTEGTAASGSPLLGSAPRGGSPGRRRALPRRTGGGLGKHWQSFIPGKVRKLPLVASFPPPGPGSASPGRALAAWGGRGGSGRAGRAGAALRPANSPQLLRTGVRSGGAARSPSEAARSPPTAMLLPPGSEASARAAGGGPGAAEEAWYLRGCHPQKAEGAQIPDAHRP